MNLTEAHIEAQARLRAATERALADLWAGLPAYDEQDVPGWLASAVPVVTAAQKTSSALTLAYLAEHGRRRIATIDAARVTTTAIRGVPAAEVYRRPFVTLWTALKAGRDYDAAVAAAAARATSTGAMDVQMAMRSTLAQAQQSDPAIRGYRRVADPGACAFCAALDGAFVRNADAMALHNRCGCGLEPIYSPVAATALPDTVAVHEHGELGPVLGDPAHDFSQVPA